MAFSYLSMCKTFSSHKGIRNYSANWIYVMIYLILPSWFSSSSVFPVQHIYLVDACLKAIEWFVKVVVTTEVTVIVISSVVDIVCIR